jgi:hypothetical protein
MNETIGSLSINDRLLRKALSPIHVGLRAEKNFGLMSYSVARRSSSWVEADRLRETNPRRRPAYGTDCQVQSDP